MSGDKIGWESYRHCIEASVGGEVDVNCWDSDRESSTFVLDGLDLRRWEFLRVGMDGALLLYLHFPSFIQRC